MTEPSEAMDQPVASPLSWRDVYRAVNESEARILQAIRDAVKPLTEASADHEQRLRRIETGDLPWVNRLAADASATHTEQGRRVGDLETAVGMFRNREMGVSMTLGFGRQLIVVVAATAGLVATLFTILDRVFPG